MVKITKSIKDFFTELLDINERTFKNVSLVFILAVIIEQIWIYSIKSIINLDLFLKIVIVLGIIRVLYKILK
jgi:hypothetical protein